MKDVKEMNQEELTQFFMEKKMSGLSYRDLANIFEKYEIADDVRKSIMAKLDNIDKKQKELKKQAKKAEKKRSGIINAIVGILILTFGFILYFLSAKAGIVFIFNFVVWAFGGLLLLRGILNFIAGSIKD